MELRKKDLRSFLDQVGDYKCRVRRCEYQIEELSAKCRKSTTSWEPGGGCGSGCDTHKDANLIMLCEKKEVLTRLLKDQDAAVAAVEGFIAKLPDYRHRAIMKLRYVDLLRWGEVEAELCAAGLPYSERQIYNLHGNALKAARKLWEEVEPNVEDSESSE